MRRLGGAGLLAAVVALGGCLDDDSVYSEDNDSRLRGPAQAVVQKNYEAEVRGDARTYCGTYTPRYLRTYEESYAKCVARFDAPRPNARVYKLRFGNFLVANDKKVIVQVGKAAYDLEYRLPVPQVGRTPRWLIDLESVERE